MLTLKKDCKGNCLWFALRQVRRHGGYFIMRRSHVGWWPHFLWSKDLSTFEEFVPCGGTTKRPLPPIWFRGFGRLAIIGPAPVDATTHLMRYQNQPTRFKLQRIRSASGRVFLASRPLV